MYGLKQHCPRTGTFASSSYVLVSCPVASAWGKTTVQWRWEYTGNCQGQQEKQWSSRGTQLIWIMFQILKNLALYYFLYLCLWSQRGWIWMACPAHTFLRRFQPWNKDVNTYGTHTKLHNQQLALCPLSVSKLNISQLFTELGYFPVSTSFTRHKRC